MTDDIQLRDIYNVTRLNREVRSVLDTGFPLIWLEGEISNLACPASGHWYLSLKDSTAQVRCAMFRTRNRLLKFVPRNGMQVIVRAKVGLYEPRGEFQLVIEHMEEAGEGALRQQFEQLKNKLNTLGLFSSEIKKSLPGMPKRIGVITSPTGAAIHDVLTTLKRRFSSLEVIIYPVSVQGKPAAEDISKTIKLANKRNECDVLLVTRGGGSLEDLWSFNEETVAYAIYESTIPVISAVGHDIDFTIADFVADVRAATPTAAAELVSPDTKHLVKQLNIYQSRLNKMITSKIQYKKEKVKQLAKNIIHPGRYIEQTNQRLDEITYRLKKTIQSNITGYKLELNQIGSRFTLLDPSHQIHLQQEKITHFFQRLKTAQVNKLNKLGQRFIHSTSTLDAISPLATLDRGYAYVKLPKNDTIIRSSKQLRINDKVETRLATGSFTAVVNKIIDK